MTSKKTLDKVSLELIKEAFNDAKEKPSILAIEGNFTIAGIKQIDASAGGGSLPPSFSYSDYAGTATAGESLPTPSTDIISAKNKITVTLPVIFYIVN